jgi:hypothetical protein
LRALAQRIPSEIFVLVSVVLLVQRSMGQIGFVHAKQAAAPGELCLSISVPEETIVANALESVGQHVEEETPDELIGRQGHRLEVPASPWTAALN